MSRFQRVMDENRRATNNVTNPNPTVPMYQINNKTTKTVKPKKKIKINLSKNKIILGVAGLIIGFIYIPQFFINDEANAKTSTISSVLEYNSVANWSYKIGTEHGTDDFDKDGLTNDEEDAAGTIIWSVDSNNNGVSDYYEVKQLNGANASNLLMEKVKELDKANNASLSSPYKMNNVILWPDDYESKVYGGVIETTAGYRFSDFKGYAQFPNYNDIYVYKYEDGVRKELKFLEKEKAWYIDEDMYVEVYSEPLEDVVKFGIFGSVSFKKGNILTKALAFILPDQGFITAAKMKDIDAEPDTRAYQTAQITNVSYNKDDYMRLTKNQTEISNLVYVRNTIKEGKCLAVSLYGYELGEAIAIVYGYTYTGDLLLADQETLTPIGHLKIEEKAKKMIDNNGNIVAYEYFDFEGFGFDSENGDRISFFAVSK